MYVTGRGSRSQTALCFGALLSMILGEIVSRFVSVGSRGLSLRAAPVR